MFESYTPTLLSNLFALCTAPPVSANVLQSCLSCAATLEYSPGSAVAIFVTYLQPKLLKRMDETEGAYNLCELTEVQLQIAVGLKDYE